MSLFSLPGYGNDNLPDLGDPSSALLSPEQEYKLGRNWLRHLRGNVPILEDPIIQEYAEHLVYQLASHSDLQEPDIALVIINQREINAFAVPGGVMGLNAGLFLEGESEAEIASVIAHEIAHISQKHFLRRHADNQRLSRVSLAAMLASIAIAVAGDAEAGLAGMAATQAAAIQQQLAYSRAHEREADREGMAILKAAEMDPDAMPRIFERMMRSQQFSGDPPEFLLTHPVTRERVADSRARAQALGTPPLSQSLYFHLAKARLTMAFFSRADYAIAYFEKQLGNGQSIPEQAARYGLALAQARDKNYEAAQKNLALLRQQSPNEQWYRFSQAEIRLAEKDYAGAIELLNDISSLMPGNYSVSLLLAQAYLGGNQLDQATSVIEPLLKQRPNDPAPWRLAADIYGKSGRLALAHQALAELLFLTGEDEKAADQLTYAMQYAKDNFPLHTQLQARRREMKAIMEEDF